MKEGNLLFYAENNAQKKLQKWKKITLLIWIPLLLVMSIATGVKWFGWRSLQKEFTIKCAHMQEQEKKMKELLVKHDQVQHYTNKITHKKETPKLPDKLLQTLESSLSAQQELEQYDMKNDECQVRLLAKNSKSLKEIHNALQKSGIYKDIFIQSFEQKPQGIVVEIHAKII